MALRETVHRLLIFAVALLASAAGALGEPIAATAPSTAPVDPNDSASGLVLLGELGCTACHAASDVQAKRISRKAAPRLADIGDRASADWLTHYLADPEHAFAGTTMPDLLSGLPAAERAADAEALTHFLLAPKPGEFRRVLPDRAAVARGEVLYHRVGCVACHAPQNDSPGLAGSVPLPRMADKWSYDGLRRFLIDPLATRPSGRMPSLRLSDAEASDIAHYLLRDTRVPAAIELATYHGRINSLDDIDSAELARTEPATEFAVGPTLHDRGNPLRFSAWLRIETPGDYTFSFTAAGASRLAINDKWIAGEESWETEKVDAKVAVHLNEGLHSLKVDYVHRGDKPPMMTLQWEGPGLVKGPIPASRLQSERDAAPAPMPFVVDPAKAIIGRSLYEKLNCATCHEGREVAKVPTLTAMHDGAGCLANASPAMVPHFQLRAAQRDAIHLALRILRRADLPPPTSRERLAQTIATLRCTACHARDGTGGPSAERDRFFTSDSQDLGDEGRLPPRLDGVGDKLRPEWIESVLTGSGSVRPYYHTRMPQFGKENVGHLPALLVELDRKQDKLVATSDAPATTTDAGRKLVGTGGLSCIVCHRFNGQPAQTLQVIDLITTPTRLNEDWFRRFLRDPAKFHPGTRMPGFWPDGKSLLPSVLDGDTDRQHAAIWNYLTDGPKAKFPEGVGRQNVELLAAGEAAVYRGKLWEAGYRGLAVAYPEMVNAAFDADDVRLSLLWKGRFLNVGPHWGIQGMGLIRPLSREVTVFAHGPEFATLADAKSPWPRAGNDATRPKFGGYQLDALKRPTLLYSVGNLQVEDFMTGSVDGGKVSIKRTIKLTGPAVAGLYFRVATEQLAGSGENAWKLGEGLTLHVVDGKSAVIRRSEKLNELLLPIVFHDNQARVEVNYAW